MHDFLPRLPTELKWHILSYIRHPVADMYLDNRPYDLLCAFRCRCSVCAQHRIFQCGCFNRLNEKDDRRVITTWLKDWNDPSIKMICEMKKRPIRIQRKRKISTVTSLRHLRGVLYYVLDAGYVIRCIPPGCRVVQNALLIC
jgi:hypothetical protein